MIPINFRMLITIHVIYDKDPQSTCQSTVLVNIPDKDPIERLVSLNERVNESHGTNLSRCVNQLRKEKKKNK